MTQISDRKPKTIRLDDRIYHQARVAAVTDRKNMGEWMEEAIREKLRRDGFDPIESDSPNQPESRQS
jgi:hypothetical protein